MTKRTRLSALASTLALALAAVGCGEEVADRGDPSAGNGTDRAFVAEMIPHHESAVDMARIAQERGESEFVRRLADAIVRTQSKEISTLRREDETLGAAGIEVGSLGLPEHAMGMEGDPAELRTARPFDKAFLEMMIPHHAGAIEMAKIELTEGRDPELKALAQDIIDAQQREIAEMHEHLGTEDAGHGSGH